LESSQYTSSNTTIEGGAWRQEELIRAASKAHAPPTRYCAWCYANNFFLKNIFYISKDSIALSLIENYKKTEEK
jgi:hypothetical protein